MKDECNRPLLLLLLGAILPPSSPPQQRNLLPHLHTPTRLHNGKSVDVRVAAETAKIENQCDVEWYTYTYMDVRHRATHVQPLFSGCKVPCVGCRMDG